ncbi:unnamed protein product [Polarella glacialis]|uniref:Uncharacterized protein n=1 Tax=Polarella glacialis TaxID=89957 RepID=A0A813DNN4_POLGL|nr:unnamed protein product [Polarella glacialis]
MLYFAFYFSALMAGIAASVAVICVTRWHPDSAYVRVAVWGVVSIWLECLFWCISVFVPCAFAQRSFWYTFFWNTPVPLMTVNMLWTAVLMLRRTSALEAAFGQPLGTDLIYWVLVIGNSLMFFLIGIQFAAVYLSLHPSMESSSDISQLHQIVSPFIHWLHVGIWFIFAALFLRAFVLPLRTLQAEAKRVRGAPRAEAMWAARRLSRECIATVGTSLYTVVSCCICGTYFLVAWSSDPDPDFQERLLMCGDCLMVSDGLVRALSLAILCGILWQDAAPLVAAPLPRALTANLTRALSEGGATTEWDQKVEELAGRGFPLSALLDFFELLLAREVMPNLVPQLSTTNDVVRQAIIPLSRGADGAGGSALATVWMRGQPVLAERMVSHAWDNTFLHLVAALVADSLDQDTFESAAAELTKPEGIPRLRAQLQLRGMLQRAYWVCALSINQHAGICGGFGTAPPEGTDEHSAWAKKKCDSVTGKEFEVCQCRELKFFNNNPVECEMNKFDHMITFLSARIPSFSLVAAVDLTLGLFMRAWCVAELIEADFSSIPIVIKIYSERTLDHHYNDCQASRVEDKAMILSRILDVDMFNARLQWLIFGSDGLFSTWLDAQGRAAHAGRIAGRARR